MSIDKRYQPTPINIGGVPLGVAQCRVGKPSVRAANYVTGTATVKAVRQVPDSTITAEVGVDGSTSINIVVPSANSTVTAATSTLTASGVYTGTKDGAFIIRIKTLTGGAGATADIYAPDGKETTGVSLPFTNYNLQLFTGNSGAIVNGNVTAGGAIGQTFLVPVYSSAAMSDFQTGIICPYSIFMADNESIGAMADAKMAFKVDDTKTYSAGFPEDVYSKVIAKTSVGVNFTSKEYTNYNLSALRDMMSTIINDNQNCSIPIAICCATTSGGLITYYVPNANLENIPETDTKQDFSTFPWGLMGVRLTQYLPANGTTYTAAEVVYNTWLREQKIYWEYSNLL